MTIVKGTGVAGKCSLQLEVQTADAKEERPAIAIAEQAVAAPKTPQNRLHLLTRLAGLENDRCSKSNSLHLVVQCANAKIGKQQKQQQQGQSVAGPKSSKNSPTSGLSESGRKLEKQPWKMDILWAEMLPEKAGNTPCSASAKKSGQR
ncbi:hypothetical protein Salat_2770400 [Sesamum alatum]|uniref:Uncharacterized protein n=1 Tax=Sesamum alatum TaxID=300844 RepID=A0AAE1XLF1_9LAMI|nr:hypothetical protein Salat_2770400 [Sesamum alatum]